MAVSTRNVWETKKKMKISSGEESGKGCGKINVYNVVFKPGMGGGRRTTLLLMGFPRKLKAIQWLTNGNLYFV